MAAAVARAMVVPCHCRGSCHGITMGATLAMPLEISYNMHILAETTPLPYFLK